MMKISVASFSLWLLVLAGFHLTDASASVADGTCTMGRLAQDGNCEVNKYDAPTPARQLDSVGSEMGEPQTVDASKQNEIFEVIAQARLYMNNVVHLDDKYKDVRDICKNQHESCAFWASLGECENNPNYMKAKCAPVCQSCDFLSIETRCPLDPNAVDALYPGDITKIFNRILTDPELAQYEPKVVSRPELAPGDTAERADYKVGGPWMVLLENALTEEEAQRMIELGGIRGYERSADVGKKLPDGTYDKKVRMRCTMTENFDFFCCIFFGSQLTTLTMCSFLYCTDLCWSYVNKCMVPK